MYAIILTVIMFVDGLKEPVVAEVHTMTYSAGHQSTCDAAAFEILMENHVRARNNKDVPVAIAVRCARAENA